MPVTDADRQATERIVAWLRRDVAAEAIRMMLAAGMPGGTRTQRTKAASFAEGCSHGVKMIIDAIERGDHEEPGHP